MKFKTTIQCGGCLQKVTPQLNSTKGIAHWEVDLNNPDKVLTVRAEESVAEDVVAAVKKVGFEIEKI